MEPGSGPVRSRTSLGALAHRSGESRTGGIPQRQAWVAACGAPMWTLRLRCGSALRRYGPRRPELRSRRRGGGCRVRPGKGQPKPVPGLQGTGRSTRALPELLVTSASEPAGRPIQHVDRPRVSDGADILERHADHQVHRAVTVEVASAQGKGEPVIGLGPPGDAAAALLELLVPGGAEPAGRPIEQIDHSGVTDGADVFERDADGQIGRAVIVEV